MEDQIIIIIFVLIFLFVGIIIFLNNFSNENNITWHSGDEKPKVIQIAPINKPHVTPKTENEDYSTIFYIVIGFVIFVIVMMILLAYSKNNKAESNLYNVENTPTHSNQIELNTIDTSSAQISNPSKYTAIEVINRLTNYFDAINNKQFFNIQNFFAPQVNTYFPYKNVSSEFAANDVIDFWSNQKQPSKIFYQNSNFEVIEKLDNYEIKGKLVEQSSLFKERIPYWIESEINYVFDKNLQLISLSGNILNKQPDLVRIFKIDDASIDDIRERENINDFKKYFNVLYKTIDIRPSIARRYIQAIKEVYGPQLLIFYKYNYYSFEEFVLNKSLLYNAYLYGIKSVDRSSTGNKVVTIFDY